MKLKDGDTHKNKIRIYKIRKEIKKDIDNKICKNCIYYNDKGTCYHPQLNWDIDCDERYLDVKENDFCSYCEIGGINMNKKDMCEMYDEMQAERYGYKKGVEDERKKRIEQLEHIQDRIEELIKVYPGTIVLIPLMDLFNEIGLMQMEDFET